MGKTVAFLISIAFSLPIMIVLGNTVSNQILPARLCPTGNVSQSWVNYCNNVENTSRLVFFLPFAGIAVAIGVIASLFKSDDAPEQDNTIEKQEQLQDLRVVYLSETIQSERHLTRHILRKMGARNIPRL